MCINFSTTLCKSISVFASSRAYSNIRINNGISNITTSILSIASVIDSNMWSLFHLMNCPVLECATFWSFVANSGLIPLDFRYVFKAASSAMFAFADHGSLGLVPKVGFSAVPLTIDFIVSALLIFYLILMYLLYPSFRS